MKIKIPVYKPYLKGNEKKYVNDCLDKSWISSRGKYIDDFEQSFADYIGVKHATTVSNGTVAIHLALLALGIKEGDEVIVPTLTYVATVNAITFVGAKPVFVDCETKTWNLDLESVKQSISSKTRAIMAVHLYGQACDIVALRALCDERKLFLIEDCAEAIGSKMDDKFVGTFGDISTFSFYGNKTITTGEGGMVVSNQKDLIDRTYLFKMQGVSSVKRYWHEVIGYNYKMTNICAAIGLAQLEQIEEIIAKKIWIAETYKKHLKSPEFSFQAEVNTSLNTFWMVAVLIKEAKKRDFLIDELLEVGIETRPLFYPVHTLPMYLNAQRINEMENAKNISARGLNLPSYPELVEDEIEFICDSIKKILSI